MCIKQIICNDCIMYLLTQIANQGIPRDINTREYLDNWNHSGAIYSGILFSFLPRNMSDIGRVTQMNKCVKYMQYSDFYELKEIGSGGYGTVYTAKYKGELEYVSKTVVLKRFKSFDETRELFISEVSNNWLY